MSQKQGKHDERAELVQMQLELKTMLATVEAKLKAFSNSPKGIIESPTAEFEQAASSGHTKRLRPVRALILDALQDLEWPAYSRELALYCHALTGRELKPERFGTLSKDEYVAYTQKKSRPRPVWLCHALTHDRHQAIKRLWARSDWPLESRVVAPTTGRIQHLKVTVKLCDIALRVEGIAADSEKMRIIAADHARDLPGINFRRGKFELEVWRDTAQRLLDQLLPQDEEARKESAQRLRPRPEVYQLFGVPDVYEGAEIEPQALRG